MFRFDVTSQFIGARERFGTDGRESLGAPFSGLLDATRLPALSALSADITSLSRTSGFAAALGTGRVDAAITAAVIPLSLQVGLTNRIMLSVSVPYFTGAQDVQAGIDPATATVGINPAITSAAAMAKNTTIVSSLTDAASNLEALASDCAANPAFDPRCAQVTAELAQVQSLIERARATTALLARIYGGDATITASKYVPFTGSATQNAIIAQLAALRSDFDRYSTTSIADGAAPVGAGAPATVSDYETAFDTASGFALRSLRRRYRQGFGDTDVGVMLRVYDGIRANPWLTDTTTSRGIRQSFGFTYRLGTGKPQDRDDPFLLATGDGQNDLEFVSATDILTSRKVWGSAVVRYTMQQPLDEITRIPDASGSPLIALDRRRNSETKLGNRLQVEVTPRYVLSEYFALGLLYRLTMQQAGTINEVAPFTDNIHLDYAIPSMTSHEVGLGFTWSSIAGHRMKRARLPLEVHYDHTMTIAGSGGALKLSADRISIRAYASFWGSHPAPVPPPQ